MKRYFIILLSLVGVLSSCNDNEIFDKEMYKNVVALISSDYYNTFEDQLSLPSDGEDVVGYIAAGSGGTHAPSQDMVIALEEDSTALNYYNRSLFDADTTNYARFLSKDRYEIADYEIRIKAGERTGRTMIKIRPEGLSPDSTYFVSLKAKGLNGVEVNEGKNTILYQVLIKNQYATQGSNDYYSMNGLADSVVTAGNKKLFPLTYNSVRVIAGTETFENNLAHIAANSIVLEVDKDNHVTIKPYKDIVVKQLDGDEKYPNVFKVEESFGHVYNVFLLSYQYTIGDQTHEMKEELRLEVTNK